MQEKNFFLHPKFFKMITVIVVLLFYVVGKTIYRLWFHPLSKFPGPRLAAISSIYEFYYSVIKGGMFIWEMERMHEEYGKSTCLEIV